MQLSKFSDYSFRALVFIATYKDRCTVETLALKLNTSIHHMKKVVYHLSKCGYIKSQKGRNGGLYLSQNPNDINLADILLKCEENLNIFDCYNNHDCPLSQKGCKLKIISKKSLDKFIKEFSKYTLEDII